MGESVGQKIIAIVSNAFVHSFQAHLIKPIEACKTADVAYAQILVQNDPPAIHDKLQNFLSKSKPYALIGICVKPYAKTLELYRSAGVPVVLIDERTEGFPTITVDNLAGGYIAGEYFARCGKKKPAFISGLLNTPGSFAVTQRLAGFKKALGENGTILPPENIIESFLYSPAGGVEAAKILLDGRREIDSVFCASGDICATGFMKEADARGKKIPGDIALIGFDDMDIARITKPTLTTIKQPIEQMAIKAYNAVVRDREKTLGSGELMLFKPELIKRESA